MSDRKKKLATNVTDAEIEKLLDEAAGVRDRMSDVMLLIGAGICDHLDDPMRYARRCMNMSRVFSDATSHFLCRHELQERDASRGVTPKPT
jgi:hypothetical protein